MTQVSPPCLLEEADNEGMNVFCVRQLSRSLICWRMNNNLKKLENQRQNTLCVENN